MRLGTGYRAVLLARAYGGLDRYGEAVESYRRALDLLPESVNTAGVNNDLGLALFNLAFVPTLDEYRRVLKQVDAMRGMGGLGTIGAFRSTHWDQRRVDHLREAERAFRQALEQSRGEANVVRFNLAQTLYRLGEFQAAHEMVEEHLAYAPISEHAEELEYCASRWKPDFGPAPAHLRRNPTEEAPRDPARLLRAGAPGARRKRRRRRDGRSHGW